MTRSCSVWAGWAALASTISPAGASASLGLERFDLVHEYGSSHGLTRIIRLAYWEHPTYVALLRRATSCGASSRVSPASSSSTSPEAWMRAPKPAPSSRAPSGRAELHGLAHEVMDGDELHRRYPGYRLPKEIQCLYQPEGGFLLPERCDVAHVEQALALGAEVRCREEVLDWEANGGRVRVRTSRGVYEAGRLVVCAGPWASKLIPELAGLTVPERQVLAWLQPTRPDRFRPAVFPVFNLEVEEGRFYGFPSFLIPGFKFGKYHHRGENVDPDTANRNPEPEDEELLRAFARRYFPEGEGPTLMLKACMFTNTPDRHFILDRHPVHPEISIAAGFSGHGYKFCSVIGEVMADLMQEGRSRHDIGFFRLGRFAGAS